MREQEIQILAKQVNAAFNRRIAEWDVVEVEDLALADQLRYWKLMTLVALTVDGFEDLGELRAHVEGNILAGLNYPLAPILGGAEVP